MCKNHHKYEIICSLKNLAIIIIFIISVATYIHTKGVSERSELTPCNNIPVVNVSSTREM